MKTLVIYHANCPDGYMAAFVASLALSGEVEYLAAEYRDPIPDLTDLTVYILDFSYEPDALRAASAAASSVLLLDHHESAMVQWLPPSHDRGEALRNFYSCEQGGKLDVRFDLERSGAGLALQYFEPGVRESLEPGTFSLLASLVRAVEDRDLWRFKLLHTRALCAAISLVDKNFTAYKRMLYGHGDILSQMSAQGETVLRLNELRCKEIAASARTVRFEGSEVPLVNCNKAFASDVGHLLSKHNPYSVSYEIRGETATVSLRGNPDSPPISPIAVKYGGGGHPRAAGFKIPAEKLFGLFEFL